jgi:hypothetical protein
VNFDGWAVGWTGFGISGADRDAAFGGAKTLHVVKISMNPTLLALFARRLGPKRCTKYERW